MSINKAALRHMCCFAREDAPLLCWLLCVTCVLSRPPRVLVGCLLQHLPLVKRYIGHQTTLRDRKSLARLSLFASKRCSRVSLDFQAGEAGRAGALGVEAKRRADGGRGREPGKERKREGWRRKKWAGLEGTAPRCCGPSFDAREPCVSATSFSCGGFDYHAGPASSNMQSLYLFCALASLF